MAGLLPLTMSTLNISCGKRYLLSKFLVKHFFIGNHLKYYSQATRHDSHVSESDAESDAEPSLHRGGSYERNRPPTKPKNGNFPGNCL
jgi:hypothetical protein